MRERIQAVQRLFWWLLGVGLVLVALALPRGNDGTLMTAVEELTRFKQGFDRTTLERSLLSHAQAQGAVRLGDVATGVKEAGGPALKVGSTPQPIQPRAMLDLTSLDQVHALGAEGATLEIGLPDREGLAQSIAWRLATRGGAGRTLISIALVEGTSSEADLVREAQVVTAREELATAERAFNEADQAHTKAADLYEARKKWKAPWKSIQRANDKRLEAKQELDARQATLDAARAKVKKLTTQARTFKPGKGGPGGAARVELASDDGKPLTLVLPVRLSRREVPVPHLTNTGFDATRAAGLWDELKDGDADTALTAIAGRFTWHYQYIDVGGFKLGGMTVLQLSPIALVVLLWLLVRRSKGVGNTYNPFGTSAAQTLPRVGLGAAPLNLVVVVVLPLAACFLSAWSLGQIKQLAVVPILCGLACVGLGALSFFEINELSSLRDAVTRSHSTPPPPNS